MIALFTDFGLQDPYVGQMHAVLAEKAPGVAVVDLFHGVPDYDVRAGAYLLPAYCRRFPQGTVFICVIDPGVGGPRRPLMLNLDGSWYVGPDNGLFHILVRHASHVKCYVIEWQPTELSGSFHGRDLFAPAAAMLAEGEMPVASQTELTPSPGAEWPDDLPQVVYIDHFGNAMTGQRAGTVTPDGRLEINGTTVSPARTFSEVEPGQAFWYENANGLVEIAVNQGRAAQELGIKLGDEFTVMA